MSIYSDRNVIFCLVVVVLVVGASGVIVSAQGNAFIINQDIVSNTAGSIPLTEPSALPLSPFQTGPMNAFPGQLIDESYYLGASSPSASYYEVTVTLNSSSYETVDALPTYSAAFSPSGYYLLFSFEMPNDQPGMWWNVAYQIIPITVTNVQEEDIATLVAQGSQVWMQYPTESMVGNYLVQGGANFTFSRNFTRVLIYPSNPKGSTIVSSQINSWSYLAGTVQVKFSLYELVNSNGPTTPPSVSASVNYAATSNMTILGSILSGTGYRITLVQGDGAYINGITSGQIAEITNSINQTLSVPISQLNAAVVSINGDVATLQTSYGTMTAELSTINASIAGIKNGQVVITTDVGDIQTSVSSLSATITSVSDGEAEIATNIGEITTSINSLNASFKGINGTEAVIDTEIGSVETSLNTINATIFAIHQGMVQMNSSIGEIQVSLRTLNSSIVTISGDTAEIMTSAGEINASLSNLNTSIFASGSGFPWFNDTYAEIETCLGNITGTITNVSNNTASIETNLGVVTASVDTIRSLNGQSSSVDPPSLFDMLVIALLGALMIIGSLAMLSSRNTLRMMGDRVK